ncbi:hypothetical protein DAEQUDRAFT_727891 [Daedalea quercina L-15889]|uniref:F-box domain-containing protein n=1 Tax=Daedalea quercina L-15889 TaxID=1314783 RepID=A0A165PQZ7_9APHY|nr:hypothetical protein DAEQUDRAFT_727891 [Daedalea quercina L-15889]
MSYDEETIEIEFRLPQYAIVNGKFPILSQELIEYTADYLWDEPVQLARCCLVCRAWYHAAIRHLRKTVHVESHNAMSDLVHILMSKREPNIRYARALKSLVIADSFGKPFAHTFPLRLPIELITALESLELSSVDWTKPRFHPNFFKYFSRFTSVTALYFWRCRFRSTEDFQRIINRLPNLKTLNLESVTVLRATSMLKDAHGAHCGNPVVRPEPRALCIWGSRSDGDRSEETPSLHTQPLHESVLNVLASYSTEIIELRLSTTQFPSFLRLQSFLRNFPRLRIIALEGTPQWRVPDSSLDIESALLVTDAGIDTWDELYLIDMSSAVTAAFVELFLAQYRKVRELDISIRGLPSLALNRAVTALTQLSARTLTKFHWELLAPPEEWSQYEPAQAEHPIPSLLIGNTRLEYLDVKLHTPSRLSMAWVYRTLLGLFSRIGSTRLERVLVAFELPKMWSGNLDPDTPTLPPTGAIAAFHAALSREEFAGLTELAKWENPPVRIMFNYQTDLPSAPDEVSRASDAIAAFMDPLFEPWGRCRGLVHIEMPDESWVDYDP